MKTIIILGVIVGNLLAIYALTRWPSSTFAGLVTAFFITSIFTLLLAANRKGNYRHCYPKKTVENAGFGGAR